MPVHEYLYTYLYIHIQLAGVSEIENEQGKIYTRDQEQSTSA
jgi:hypothetical protein